MKSPGSSPQLVTAADATNDGGVDLELPTDGLLKSFAAKALRKLCTIVAPLNGCIAGAEGCAASTDSLSTNSEAKTAANGLSCSVRGRGAFILYMTNLQEVAPEDSPAGARERRTSAIPFDPVSTRSRREPDIDSGTYAPNQAGNGAMNTIRVEAGGQCPVLPRAS